MSNSFLNDLRIAKKITEDNSKYVEEFNRIHYFERYSDSDYWFIVGIVLVICELFILKVWNANLIEKILSFPIHIGVIMLLISPISKHIAKERNEKNENALKKRLDQNSNYINELIIKYSQNQKELDLMNLLPFKYRSKYVLDFLISCVEEGKVNSTQDLFDCLNKQLDFLKITNISIPKYVFNELNNSLFSKTVYDSYKAKKSQNYNSKKIKKKKYRLSHKSIKKIEKRIMLAKENLYVDPGTVLMQVRTIGEDITNCILICENLEIYKNEKQQNKLNILENNNILDSVMITKLHNIRIKGNKAAHESYDSLEDSNIVLTQCKEIYNCFKRKYVI